MALRQGENQIFRLTLSLGNRAPSQFPVAALGVADTLPRLWAWFTKEEQWLPSTMVVASGANAWHEGLRQQAIS